MYNLNQSHLRIVTRLDNIYTYDVEVSKCENCKPQSYNFQGGYTASILTELSRYLNFSFELLSDPSLTYRFDLASEYSVDLFAASYSLQRLNSSDVVPTFVTGVSRIQMFLNRQFESSMNDAVFLPFDKFVWVLLLLLTIFVTICSGGFTRLTENIETLDGAFQILAIACLKGCGVIVQSMSSRIITWTMSITFVVIFAAYSGSIVSINAVKKYSIDSFEEVLSSHFDIGFDVGFNNGSVIQRATDEILNTSENIQQMYKRMLESVFRSKYRPAINFGIQRLRETGQLRYFMRKWIPGIGDEACSSRNAEDSSVNIGQLQSAFLIDIVGTILAFIFFVGEKILKWKTNNVETKVERGHSKSVVKYAGYK
ncbi:unnamed protein product [Allacma fusca]|uniref:Ionotropic glutamate receptor C-terminal domain-containing protein n=1 Tax=Allacma fusca TaxID=39272 RepID=A0A8J2LG30_9HEXA|nr:unnamed protein product [Allacma fusca]